MDSILSAIDIGEVQELKFASGIASLLIGVSIISGRTALQVMSPSNSWDKVFVKLWIDGIYIYEILFLETSISREVS